MELKLRVQLYLFFRDEQSPLITASFRELGGSFLRDWLAGAKETSRARVLRYYKETAAAIRYFEARFSGEYLQKVKRKTLYWDTLDMLYPPPIYRSCVGDIAVSKDVFHRVRRYPVKIAMKNFFVRFHFEVLPVKTWLVKKGFFEPWSTNCALCPFPETLEHVFLYCTNAELFWAELRAELCIDLYVGWEQAKFLKFETCPSVRAWEIITLLGLWALWRSRTDHLHVVEGGKPAWRHFVEGFDYVASLTKEAAQPGLECWEELSTRLQRRTRKQQMAPG